MPTRWTLIPTSPLPTDVSPLHLHALACRLFETPDSDHTAQVKPFTAALAPASSGPEPASAPHLAVTWLHDATEPDLVPHLATPVALGSHTTRLILAERRAEPYTRLAAAPPATKVHVEFSTPAYVNQGGRQLPLPVPELLLAGLARRWDAFSPHPLPPGAVAETVESAHLARHDIRTRPVGSGRHQRTGFVGSAVLALPSRASRPAQRAFTALWGFAAYAGVGAQTTHGLGYVRVHLRTAAPPTASPAPALSEKTP
ncbi:CRISPR system precrRNA processing endoribonuclease RAMP protein Cas6 [Nocardiopsis algeriensis]|uniref:CRISPR system precrRNA processing endoribonuclease RAMP protein Cas6 n=1 Tax=Nocardiopsis algeriensis TaxID=1478215 RepID=UPI003B42C845